MPNDYKHKTLIQIRFADIDSLDHVNHAKHITYMEHARISYFTDVIKTPVAWKEEGLILAKVVVDYKLPLLLGDTITVYTKCTRIGNKSFDLSYSIMKVLPLGEDLGGAIAATGLTTMVCYDYKQNKTIAVPEEWKKKMMEFEK